MLTYQQGITKQEFVTELKKHHDADRFVRGTYWNAEKGCAVGCSIQSISRLKNIRLENGDHGHYETFLGIPKWLAQLEDTIFEGCTLERSKTWPLEFSEAIPEGVDLEKTKVPIISMILEHSLFSLDQCKYDEIKFPKVKEALEASKNVVQMMIDAQTSGDQDDIEKAQSASWSSAQLAARSSAQLAALSAAESAALSAAWSASWSSAQLAARSAAWSAAQLAAWSARSAAESAESAERSAESAAFDYYANRVIEILRDCR